MTNLLRYLLGLVLLVAFGCQDREEDTAIVLTYQTVAGYGYEGTSYKPEIQSPDEEYWECREIYPGWQFFEGEVIATMACDLYLTRKASDSYQEMYYGYPLFTVHYSLGDVEEGRILSVFFADGQSAEFDSAKTGTVYPDGSRIHRSDDLSDTFDQPDVPELDEMPDDINEWVREYFAETHPQGEPDRTD